MTHDQRIGIARCLGATWGKPHFGHDGKWHVNLGNPPFEFDSKWTGEPPPFEECEKEIEDDYTSIDAVLAAVRKMLEEFQIEFALSLRRKCPTKKVRLDSWWMQILLIAAKNIIYFENL